MHGKANYVKKFLTLSSYSCNGDDKEQNVLEILSQGCSYALLLKEEEVYNIFKNHPKFSLFLPEVCIFHLF